MELSGYLAGDCLVVPAGGGGKPVLLADEPSVPEGFEARRAWVEEADRILGTWELVAKGGTEADAAIGVARIVAASLPDADALAVKAIYPRWSGGGVEYHGKDSPTGRPQDRLLHGDTLYKVVKDHTSQPDWTPDVATSLYAPVRVNDTGYEEWDPDTISYDHIMTGDVRWHEGRLWVSLRDGNTSEPGTDEWWDPYEG